MQTLRLFALLSCFCAPFAICQTYTVGHTEFVNSGPYTHDELEAVAALHPGMHFTADDLIASAQRLADTGYFDDVAASLMGRFAAMTVTYQLKPASHDSMLPVGFQNLVWLTHDEIEAAVRAKSPLFRDSLPEGSPAQDLIRAALTEALAAKGVPASVTYETVEPTLQHPVREIEFRASKPFVRVANVKLAGVQPQLVPLVQRSVNDTARTPFAAGPDGLDTADRILSPLLDAGYIQATLSSLQVTASPMANDTVPVVVSATLSPGAVYKVSAIQFSGAPLLSAEAFAASAKLHPGDIASRKALLETLEPIDSAYRRQGYMDVTVIAKPTFHEETHEVAYTVTVSPGEPYRIDQLSAENLDPEAKAAFDKVFLMKKGELYNPEYVAGFLKGNSSVVSLRRYIGNYVAYAHPKTHTVDLVVSFATR